MNTHAGYSKKTLTDTNVLLTGGGDKSLADFLGGIQYVSASHKILIKTAASNASWTDLVTLITTDENVKLIPKTDNTNRPLMMINGGTATGTLTSTSMFSVGIYANASTNVITAGGFAKTGSDGYHILLGNGEHSELKTINGNSLFGSGNIVITSSSGGGDGNTLYYLTLNNAVNGHSSGTNLGTLFAPTAGGTAGQYLKSNGSGAPTWATFDFASSGHSHTLKIETTSDNSSINLAASTKYKLTAGGSTYVFKTPAGGSTGSDVNVKQVYTSTSASRPLLMKYGNTSSTSDVTNNVYYDTGVYANPYDHSLTATSFNGTLYGSATNLRSRGDVTCETSTTRPAVDGLSMSQAYSNGYPYDYGNIITCKGTGDNELLLCWSGTSGAHASAYIRSRRDVSSAAWSDWAEIITSANYTNYLTTSGGTSVYQYHNQSMSSNTNYRILTSTRTSNGTLENVYSKSACYMNDNGVYFTSDKKMKKDIRMFSLETNIMDCYNPVRRFSWKSNDMPSIGFISQEVEEWCPEAVGISDDGLKTVNYDVALSALCGAMFNRIKELEQTVKELQYQININKR